MSKPLIQTLKGFRDFLPEEKRKRDYVIEKIKAVFELYGFEPLETPALEYASLLLGKYGKEADKLIYKFKDRGGREVALRYDQTVPLIRVVYQYQNQLLQPFKRYQIQPVWRAENPQKGRFREFLQCDIDTINSSSLLADAEIIACSLETLKKLGFKNIQMLINDRSSFKNLKPKFVATIDKLEKIGRQAVVEELTIKGMNKTEAQKTLACFENNQPTSAILNLFKYLKDFGLTENKNFIFKPCLARGLDYYTGSIFELVSSDYPGGSLGGGGRYDRLIGIPAVGFAFGFDRLVEAMNQLQLFPPKIITPTSKVLVTVFKPELLKEAIKILLIMRKNNINAEIYLDKGASLDKQLKYADRKGIPWVTIIGPNEVEQNGVVLKNLETKKQETITLKEVIKKILNFKL